nr:triose-phosphate isomerase [uncultured Moellerella sp.]
MKKIMIGTSWKMNKPLSEAMNYCRELSERLPEVLHPSIQAFLIPPFTAIHPVSEYLKQHQLDVLVGAQNMHFAEQGAWTGEISASMIAETGATLVELGHSERRNAFNETDATINKKVHTALAHGLRPLICIGDSADEKQWGVSSESVIRQMKIALYDLDEQQALQMIVAYEPIWAIGEHGVPATAQEAQAIHLVLREALCERFGKEIGLKITLLYGGSVNPSNAVELLCQQDIDGLFIGRAAWSAEGYSALIQLIAENIDKIA